MQTKIAADGKRGPLLMVCVPAGPLVYSYFIFRRRRRRTFSLKTDGLFFRRGVIMAAVRKLEAACASRSKPDNWISCRGKVASGSKGHFVLLINKFTLLEVSVVIDNRLERYLGSENYFLRTT